MSVVNLCRLHVKSGDATELNGAKKKQAAILKHEYETTPFHIAAKRLEIDENVKKSTFNKTLSGSGFMP